MSKGTMTFIGIALTAAGPIVAAWGWAMASSGRSALAWIATGAVVTLAGLVVFGSAA